ncbi:hypothetical protein TNIN_368011 [Trichonephila inaurata madagascariensis]|uniref:Uncharacterized protein n=1 Tax=Trichonephila inaurata madagascariensis TaxID=2747483 RepID=A0A8X6XN61_9ARAC|nr:hypothetical protein TNIN_368011 [Trichonephila inaurata madagascariensis]
MTACETICIDSKLFFPRYALCAALERSWSPHIFYTMAVKLMANEEHFCQPANTGRKRKGLDEYFMKSFRLMVPAIIDLPPEKKRSTSSVVCQQQPVFAASSMYRKRQGAE